MAVLQVLSKLSNMTCICSCITINTSKLLSCNVLTLPGDVVVLWFMRATFSTFLARVSYK